MDYILCSEAFCLADGVGV